MHFRKFSPIDRENSIFELVDENEVLLDVFKSDEGKLNGDWHHFSAYSSEWAHSEGIFARRASRSSEA